MTVSGDEQLIGCGSAPTVADRHRIALDRIADAVPVGPAPTPGRIEGDARFPPSAAMAELAPHRLMTMIDSAGCALVPSLVTAELAAELVDGIDRAFDAYDRHGGESDTGDPWFDAFVGAPGNVHSTRPWLRHGGGLFTADSPQLCARWFGLLHELGVTDLVTELFGEAPVTSLDKCALRKIRSGSGIEWHQDGSFLGVGSGALNLWVSLSDTADAPGLDIVNRRFTGIVETGTGGASYDWSTGPEVVDQLAESTPIEQPRFRPGDGLFFDGMLLHRTSQPPDTGNHRYAIETWFFRPSRFPDHQQIPLAL